MGNSVHVGGQMSGQADLSGSQDHQQLSHSVQDETGPHFSLHGQGKV